MKRTIRHAVSIILALVLAAFGPEARAIGFSAEEVYESVFVIETDISIGSGFAVSENEVVTNAHVISRAGAIRVITRGGDSLAASVVAYDEDLDLAVLYVADGSFSALPAASLDTTRVGDDVYAIGAPKSMAYTLTKGIISSKDRVIRGRQYIQIDAAVNDGNSGGPLLDANGNVLGVITLKLTDAEGIGMAIPITVVSDWRKGVDTSPPAPSGNSQNTAKDGTGSPPDVSAGDEPNSPRGAEKVNAALVIALSISVLINIGFTVFCLLSRKKNKPVSNPSPDRMDFEIEFEA